MINLALPFIPLSRRQLVKAIIIKQEFIRLRYIYANQYNNRSSDGRFNEIEA